MKLFRYFIPHAVKSGELLRFVRSKYSIKYRASPRIPVRQVPAVRKFSDAQRSVLFGRIAPKKPPEGKPAVKKMYIDISDCYDMYNRPILVRDHNNEYRTANYEERRKVNDSRRYIKKPAMIIPYFWPNENEMDYVRVIHRSPKGFQVQYDYEGDTSLDVREKWEKKAAEAEWKDPHDFDRYKIKGFTTSLGGRYLDNELKDKKMLNKLADESVSTEDDSYTREIGEESFTDADEEQMATIFGSPMFRMKSPYERDDDIPIEQ